jgi:Tfp pilus assembly protein PilO
MKNYRKLLFKYYNLVMPMILIISLIIGWVVLLPKFNQVKKIYTTIQKDRERNTKLQAKVHDLETLNEYELSEKSDILLVALPSLKNPAGMIVLVGELAEDNSLLVESLKVSPGEVATESAEIAEVEKLVFKLSLSGEISQFLNFLKATGESLPLIDLQIKSFDISGQSFTTEVSLISYYSGLPKTLGKADSAVPKLSNQEEGLLEQLREFNIYEAKSFKPGLGGKPNPFTF